MRLERLIGSGNVEILAGKSVTVCGIGAVGGHALETIARCGIGHIRVVDFDRIEISNINRQILALHSTLGMLKTDAAALRVKDINPDCAIETLPLYISEENLDEVLCASDILLDCIDSLSAKVALLEGAYRRGIPIISSMGAGNKLNPFLFETADIYETSVCPLARVMRRELRKRGIRHLKVVYSKEEPLKPLKEADGPGSTAFVPSAAGLLIASEVIRDLTGDAVRKARAERE